MATPTTTKLPSLTGNVGTQAQRDAINKTISGINSALAGGITGISGQPSGSKGAVYFTPKGAVNSAGTPVTPATEMNTPAINLPPKPVPANMFGITQGANASVAPGLAALGYTQDPTTGQYTYTAPKVDGTVQTKDNFQSLLEGYLGNQPEKPSAERMYTDLYNQAGIKQKEQAVQSYTNQINAITSEANANALAVTGQGRGIPEVIIGGQQAQIQKEAAIRTLPLTAQLAAAQGDLATAQKHLDTLYSVRMADATAEYEYKSKIVSAVYDFATKAEQRKLDAVQLKEEQAFQLKRDDAAFERQKYMSELGFRQDLTLKGLNAQGQPIAGTTGTTTNSPLQLAQAQNNITLAADLLKNPALTSSVGPTLLSRLRGKGFYSLTGKTQEFNSGVQQLVSQLSLDSLIRAKANGATFGALSDTELKILASSATKLEGWAKKDSNGNFVAFKTSESAFKDEIDKINNLAKLDYLLKGGRPEDVNVEAHPDGTYWTINNKGIPVELK
jgi:hypothetical protein